MEKGIKKGMKQERKEMAKRMKEKGIDIITIQEITNLTEEEINSL